MYKNRINQFTGFLAAAWERHHSGGLMNTALLCTVLLASSPPVLAESTHTLDENSLKVQGAEYARAFAKADVNTLANFWDDSAVYADQFGNVYHSKAEIKKQYEGFFNKYGAQPIQISVESISFPSNDVAIETGVTRLENSSAPDATTHYLATHVKRDGKWLMQSVSETPFKAASNGEYLKPLDWLLGRWKASNSQGASLELKLSWVNKNVIAREANVTTKDGHKISHTEYIYWNPQAERVCSWQYDADGGTSQSWWERNGDAWIVHSNSMQADGSPARADYILKPADQDSFNWQSTHRSLAGEDLPDTELIKVTRVKS